jgi:hypothetical protein
MIYYAFHQFFASNCTQLCKNQSVVQNYVPVVIEPSNLDAWSLH